MKLSELDFEVDHRSGTKMLHVDALSRMPIEDCTEVEPAELNVFYVNIDTEDWLTTIQQQDQELINILQI